MFRRKPVPDLIRDGNRFADKNMRRSHPTVVIPGRRVSAGPGIHTPRLWLWIPGSRLTARPGMTPIDSNFGIAALVVDAEPCVPSPCHQSGELLLVHMDQGRVIAALEIHVGRLLDGVVDDDI